MLHRRQGFPDNRAFKVLPNDHSSSSSSSSGGGGGKDGNHKDIGDCDYRLYFSPDLAMANELCSTGDAEPAEFKFFQWATVWLPKQIELEYDKRAWITLRAPVSAIFDDDDATSPPLWRRLVGSLPPGLLQQ
jgi:hypothetical protein